MAAELFEKVQNIIAQIKSEQPSGAISELHIDDLRIGHFYLPIISQWNKFQVILISIRFLFYTTF